jgi:clan AA aspartic protease
MGIIHAEVELINGDDISLARKQVIGEEEIKRIQVSALVDTGAVMLCINENIQEILQLPVVGSRKAQLANGSIVECKVVSPLDLRFKNRETTCRAMVLPGDSEVLLGAIPLEDLDVLIDPIRLELIVHPERPDVAMTIIKELTLA